MARFTDEALRAEPVPAPPVRAAGDEVLCLDALYLLSDLDLGALERVFTLTFSRGAADAALNEASADVVMLASPLASYGPPGAVLERIRSSRSHSQLLLAINDADRSQLADWMDAGACAFVLLPAPLEEVSALIRLALRRARETRLLHEEQAAVQRRLEHAEDLRARLQLAARSVECFEGKNDIRDFGPRLIQRFAEVLDAGGGSLFLCHPDHLERLFAIDPDHVPKEIPLPLRPGSVFGRAMEGKQAIIITDIGNEGSLEPSGWDGYANGSLFVFPLMDAEDRVGALVSLHSKRYPDVTEADRELGNLIARLSSEAFRGYLTAQALQENECHLDTLMSNLPGIVYRCRNDSFWTMLYVSEGCVPLTGYQPEDLLYSNKLPYVMLIDPEDRLRVHAEVNEAIAQDQAFRVSYRIVHADGSRRWVWEQGRRVNGAESEGHAVLEGLIIDITEQREAQAALSRLGMAVNQATELILITDTAGNIIYVNPAFEKMTGYTSAEVIGQTPRMLQSGDHSRALYEELWSILQRGQTWRGRLTNRKKDARLFTVETTISPLWDDAGEVVNYVAVSRDVTKEAELESQLRQAQKLEAIGQLAAGVAHEISTPTQYVGDNVRFIDSSFKSLVQLQERYEQLARAAEEGAELATLLQDVAQFRDEIDLDFLLAEIPESVHQSLEGLTRVADIVRALKIFAHPGDEAMSAIDLNDAIRSTVIVARNEYKYVADLDLNLDETMPLVTCRVGEVNQVVLNLIINAAHAIAATGAGAGSAKGKITISTSADNTHAEIHVSDTGTGIAEAIRDRVFEPFFTTKDVGKGTGQGLALTHRVVVKNHHGSIRLETEVGAGATFILCLPLIPPSAEEVKQRHTQEAQDAETNPLR